MDHTRHISIFDASGLSVSLVGAGGIGAITALMLAKMGVHDLVVYDDDLVSSENLPTQLHALNDLGEAKVDGLTRTISTFSDDTLIHPTFQRVTADMALYGQVVISAVDSIAARKDIWAAVKNGAAGWYIDARMSAEEFQMHVVDMSKPDKVARYDTMISQEDDSRVADIPCTAKATFYCAAFASGYIGSAVRKIITGHRPAAYLVHNIFRDKLFALGEA